MSPTSLSLTLLRRWRFLADVAERWVPLPDKNIKRDLFGAFDIVAVDVTGKAVWMVQCTSLANLSTRVSKCKASFNVAKLVQASVVCECWGWKKRGDRWTVKRVRLEGDTLEPVDVQPRRRPPRKMDQQTMFE